MKIYVQIVDSISKISQNGMIEEPVKEGLEISNALGHFGVGLGYVVWKSSIDIDGTIVKSGIVEGTSKIVNVIGCV